MHRNEGQKPWSFRRRVIIATLLFCAFMTGYVTIFGHDSERIGESIVVSAFSLAGAVIGSYIFGAVWQDKGEDNGK